MDEILHAKWKKNVYVCVWLALVTPVHVLQGEIFTLVEPRLLTVYIHTYLDRKWYPYIDQPQRG